MGRPKGSLSRRTIVLRAAAEGALKPGKTPLDVMLRNMRFYDEKAESAMKWLEEQMASTKAKPLEVLKLLAEMNEYRMKAQKCAVDAAPFVHPRLSNIEYKNTTDTIKAKPEGDMTPDELAEYYNKLRLRPTSVNPLVIDNETSEPVYAGAENDDAPDAPTY